MKNKVENIKNSNIVIGSTINGNVENSVLLRDPELKKAIDEISKIIDGENNVASSAIFEKFKEEISKPQKKLNLIKKYWDGLITLSPKILNLANTVKIIETLLNS